MRQRDSGQPLSIGQVGSYSPTFDRGLIKNPQGGVPEGKGCAEPVALHQAISARKAPLQAQELLQGSRADDWGAQND